MTGSSPKAQAAAAAYGSVPTKGSITRQYGTQIGNAEAFTKALIGLLQQGPSIGSAYNSAIANQRAVNNAATQRIAAITGQTPQTLGSQAAVGGMGDSSMGHLLANQGAAKAYGAQLPTIAASRGQLARQTLVTAENQALQARNDAYRQSYVSALGQARQNAFNQRMALADLGLKRQSLAMQNRQFQAGQAYRYAALAENRSQFNRSQAQQYQEFLIGQQQAIQKAKQSGMGQFTPSEIATMARMGQQQADGFTTSGVTIQRAIQQLAVHMPLALAQHVALTSYANLSKPNRHDPVFHRTVKGVDQFNKGGFLAAMKAYKVAYNSWRQYLNNQLRRSTLKNQKSQGTAPGQGRGIG